MFIKKLKLLKMKVKAEKEKELLRMNSKAAPPSQARDG